MKPLILILCLLSVGCSATRGYIVDASNEGVKNAETSRIVAGNILDAWALNSGAYRIVWNDLKASTQVKITQLDEIARARNPQKFDTDFQLGLALGYWGKINADMVELAISKIMKYIPIP